MRTTFRISLFGVFITLISVNLFAEDGYKLWLRYDKIIDLEHYEYASSLLGQIAISDNLDNKNQIEEEFKLAVKGMLGKEAVISSTITSVTSIILNNASSGNIKVSASIKEHLHKLGPEGFILHSFSKKRDAPLVISANSSKGLLYGTFCLLRTLQSKAELPDLPYSEKPRITNRILNHWDNLDRTVERGYAGFSIWDWHKLPGYISPRYIDYARANASIGINGTVLTNVNSNALVLTPMYLEKVKALADVFRAYGIKVYLTARFSAPIEIGGLKTADPLDKEVQDWWSNKVKEIYEYIPDFGGFLVKANSEGQPGPQDYNRTHAEGANMLAQALAPHKGLVIWRAFVYSAEEPEDRAKQANMEFEPLDGQFMENVFIQAKNGAIDFQPREPFHPLFGKLHNTPLALELQITQEYLGQGTSLCFLAPLFKECLESQTFLPLKESRVSDIIDGTAYNREQSVIAGVSNIGTDRNWTGHLFGQANWYAFGRLAWDHQISSEQIAEEWIKLSFGSDEEMLDIVSSIMLSSRETVVNYMTPLGLHHIMGANHHYGPGPWVDGMRADWTSVYYHKADADGIGFNRTSTGSNALSQYAPEIEKLYSDPSSCPEKYLLWFHHLPWNYRMKSGNSLWDELCYHYYNGVVSVEHMLEDWESLEEILDIEIYNHVKAHLGIQLQEARWWKDACLLYFQQFSQLPFPYQIEAPSGTLDDYKNLSFPYAPGIKPRW